MTTFMKPQTYFGLTVSYEEKNGGTYMIPAQHAPGINEDEIAEALGVDPETVEFGEGYYGRVSAPGYLDCSDWYGPYDSEKELLEMMEQLHPEEMSAAL